MHSDLTKWCIHFKNISICIGIWIDLYQYWPLFYLVLDRYQILQYSTQTVQTTDSSVKYNFITFGLKLLEKKLARYLYLRYFLVFLQFGDREKLTASPSPRPKKMFLFYHKTQILGIGLKLIYQPLPHVKLSLYLLLLACQSKWTQSKFACANYSNGDLLL